MEQPSYQLPSDTALQGVLDELNKALKEVPDTQRRLMSLTGVAWSADGMVKAEVGPRGQLVDLEIDQRVFRRPDAHALKASIMEAVSTAVRQVAEQSHEIIMGQIPPEVAELRTQFGRPADDPTMQMIQTDAEIVAKRKRADGDLR